MLEGVRRVHFVGVGGAGMAPIAQVLAESGLAVQGSDMRAGAVLGRLESKGVRVFIGHRAEQVVGADLVVISSAVPADNPEVLEARARGIRIVKRAEMWGELMRRQRTIAVAGTHGKTTTTAMVATVLTRAGLDPTVLIGGDSIDLEGGAKRGLGKYLIAEADEYDGSFLKFAPWVAVVTNVEPDHLDYYGSFAAILEAFGRFLGLLPPDGHAVLCWDDRSLRALSLPEGVGLATFGFEDDAEWRAVDVRRNDAGGNDFVVMRRDRQIGDFRLRVPGRHNVSNALAALAVANILGLSSDEAREGLKAFAGTRRRLELRGRIGDVEVYDDYAHHPTEIKATLGAARERQGGRLIVVFQPHTYHRTKQLLPEFARAFELADRVLITDIYLPPGREVDTLGISARDLVAAMQHPGASYVGPLLSALATLKAEIQLGDRVIVMGAGDVYTIADELVGQRSPSG